MTLVEALKVLAEGSLTSIDLSGQHIGDEGAVTLAKALEANKTVTWIDLSKNGIGDLGTAALAKALEVNTRLTSISLMDNEIQAQGAQAIGKALEKNQSVKVMLLGKNKIGVEGARGLGKSLLANTTLTSIELSNNGFGDEGAEAIVTNTPLQWMDLADNGIGNAGAERLAKVLEKNRTLIELDLRDNNFDTKLRTQIFGRLHPNAHYALQIARAKGAYAEYQDEKVRRPISVEDLEELLERLRKIKHELDAVEFPKKVSGYQEVNNAINLLEVDLAKKINSELKAAIEKPDREKAIDLISKMKVTLSENNEVDTSEAEGIIVLIINKMGRLAHDPNNTGVAVEHEAYLDDYTEMLRALLEQFPTMGLDRRVGYDNRANQDDLEVSPQLIALFYDMPAITNLLMARPTKFNPAEIRQALFNRIMKKVNAETEPEDQLAVLKNAIVSNDIPRDSALFVFLNTQQSSSGKSEWEQLNESLMAEVPKIMGKRATPASPTETPSRITTSSNASASINADPAESELPPKESFSRFFSKKK